MRLARPIFNKQGVMLYERDSKLTPQGINSIHNFELIGIYILEPAEPLPPMTEDDREFERFQTMSVFVLQEIMDDILNGEPPQKLRQFSQEILAKFSVKNEKFTFMQNLRSKRDMVYKHSLNVAILAAAIAGKMNISIARQRSTVMTALLHDSGRCNLSEKIAQKSVADLTPEEQETIFTCLEGGYLTLRDNGNIDHDFLRNTQTFIKTLREIKTLEVGNMLKNNNPETEILKLAYYFV